MRALIVGPLVALALGLATAAAAQPSLTPFPDEPPPAHAGPRPAPTDPNQPTPPAPPPLTPIEPPPPVRPPPVEAVVPGVTDLEVVAPDNDDGRPSNDCNSANVALAIAMSPKPSVTTKVVGRSSVPVTATPTS